MRRGHCKRLSGDEGRESKRGRTTFARSVNKTKGSRREDSMERDFVRAKRELKRQLQREAALFEVEGVDEGAVAEQTHLDQAATSPFTLLAVPELLRQRSAPCTVAEWACAESRAHGAYVPLRAWPLFGSSPAPVAPRSSRKKQRVETPWEAALARAKVTASVYVRTAPRESEARRPRRIRKRAEVDAFEILRGSFLRLHSSSIRNSLARCFDGKVRITPAPVAEEVKKRFLNLYSGTKGHEKLLPAFHGTKESNHKSIFANGLLIPGRNNELKVANGSAHGLGIYTASVENAWLSCGFCSAPRMLICGVLDNSKPVPSRLVGRFSMNRASEQVQHVGDAIVVFDDRRVMPLFEAEGRGFRPRDTANRSIAPPLTSSLAPSAPVRRVKQKRKAPVAALRQGLRGLANALAFLARRAVRKRL